MLELTKKLCSLYGTSGDEKDVRLFIINELQNIDCDITIDRLGNVIVFKKGKQRPQNKVMFAAHMDEVGFITQYIEDSGMIRLKAVGGITPQVVAGRQLCFKNGTIGVVGVKPIHKLKGDEKDTQPKLDDLYVDIGATSREDAEKYVSLGDNAYFVGDFFEYGSGFVAGRAIDDRLGCAIMLDMLKSETEYDAHFVFTTAEEVGTRGAAAATYTVMPDIAIVLEATTACDIPDSEGGDRVCALGSGTVVSFMDMGTVYDRELYQLAFATADENNLKCQTKTKVAGGNDSSAIHKALSGVRTIALSAPCRYLHTAHCVVKRLDCAEMRIFAEKLLSKAAVL